MPRLRRARFVLLLLLFVATEGVAEGLRVHLAGDSTMAEKRPEKRPETGWGEALATRLAPAGIRVLNHARNGRSTRTFIEEGRWQGLLGDVRPGDVVLIQFGHNDQSVEKPDRYTPIDDYARHLAGFVDDVRARGALAVLLTPVTRRRFDAAGAVVASHGNYPDRVRALAASRSVPLIDLERRTQAIVQERGVEASRRLYLWGAPGEHGNYPGGIEDNTHFSPAGADAVAASFLSAIEDLCAAGRAEVCVLARAQLPR